MGLPLHPLRTEPLAIAGRQKNPASISFPYIVAVLRHRKSLVITAISVTLTLALLYLIFAPVRYTATSLMLLDSKRTALAETGIAAEPQVDEGFVESQIQTLKSDNVAAIVVKKLNLAEDPEFVPPPTFLDNLMARLTGGPSQPSEKDLTDRAVEAFGKALTVSRMARSYVAQISFTSLSKPKAVVITNAVSDAYIEDQLQAKSDVTRRAGSWLRERIGELRTQATDAFREVQDFKSRNSLIIGSDGRIPTDLEIEQLAGSLAQSRTDTARAQSRLSEIEAALSTQKDDHLSETAVTDALNNPVIIQLRQQYLEDKKRATILTAGYGRNHEAVSRLEADMNGLARGIREEMQRIAETYKSELVAAKSREESIAKRLVEIFHNDSDNRQLQVMFRDLETMSSTYRSTYENFLNKYTQIVQQQSFPSIEARMITRATVGVRTSPKVGLTLMLATLVGTGFGIAAAFIRGQTDRIVYSRGQLTSEIGASCISVLPKPEKPPHTLFSDWKERLTIAKWAQSEPAGADGQLALPIMLYNEAQHFSLLSEQLRNIRIFIDLRKMSEKTNTIAIVSAKPREGKSTVAMSVAASIAETGKKVLLLDLDFRKPSLTQFFGLPGRSTIMDVLSGEANLREVAIGDRRYGFDFLCAPTKGRPADLAGILPSRPMISLIAEASKEYEYIVVDLPPVLSAADVRICARLFDAFVMVVEWGKTSLDDLDRAFRVVPVIRERLLGIVLNRVDVKMLRRIERSGEYTNTDSWYV